MLKGDQQVMFLVMDTNFLRQFASRGTRYMEAYVDASQIFDTPRQNIMLHSPVRPSIGNVLTLSFIKETLLLERQIKQRVRSKMMTEQGRFEDTLDDLCVRTYEGASCSWISIATLLGIDLDNVDRLLNEGETVHELMSKHETALQQAGVEARGLFAVTVGGLTQNQSRNAPYSSWAHDVGCLQTIFTLVSAEEYRLRAQSFEQKVVEFALETYPLQLLGSGNKTTLRTSVFAESTLSVETANLLMGSIEMVFVTMCVMIGWALTFLGTQTRQPNETQQLLIMCACHSRL